MSGHRFNMITALPKHMLDAARLLKCRQAQYKLFASFIQRISVFS
jgi:hypothetical protein